MKKIFVGAIAVSLLFTCSGMMDLSSLFTIQNNNNVADNSSSNNDIPTMPDSSGSTEKESSFSLAMNSLLQAKEIIVPEMTLTVLLNNSADSLTLTLTNLDVDLSNLNTVSLALSCKMTLNYNNMIVSLDRFIITQDDKLYITYNGNTLSFEAPQNFADLMDVFKYLGLVATDSASSLDVNLSNLISTITESLEKATSSETSTNDGHLFTLTFPSLDLENDNVLSSFTLQMESDKDDKVTYLGTKEGDPLVVRSKESDGTYTNVCSISFDMPLTVKSSSTYDAGSIEEAVDTTEANGALLSTISKIFIKNGSEDNVYDCQAQVGIDVSLVNEEDSTTYAFNGEMKIDASNVFQSFENSKVEVNLTQTSNEETFNTMSAYYTGGDQATTYLKLNNNFKGKIANSNLDDIFEYVSGATGQAAIDVITKRLGDTMQTLDFDAFADHDFSSLTGFLKSINYDEANTTYTIVLEGSTLMSSLSDITLELVLDANRGTEEEPNDNYGIESINISGLSILGYNISLGLSLENLTSFTTINYDDYVSYRNTLSLFETLANLVSKEKMAVDYDLVYYDDYNVVSYNAAGQIGVDISNVSSMKSFYKKESDGSYVDDLSKGRYYLSMVLDTGDDTLAHGFNMKYYTPSSTDESAQPTLYMDYGTTSTTSNTTTTSYVFKNQIVGAQLGDFVDYLDTNTDSSASSSLFDMNSILTDIGCSAAFTAAVEAIQNGNLSLIDQYFTQECTIEDGVETLTLSLIDDSSTPSFSLKLIGDSGSYELTKISILGERISNDSEISLDLTFTDFDEDNLTVSNPSEYGVISDANQILQSFYTLPNRLDSFAVQISGDIGITTNNNDDGSTNTSNYSLSNTSGNPSGIYMNMEDSEHPWFRGNVYITHPTLTSGDYDYTQNIEFEYLTKELDSSNTPTDTVLEDPQIIAEYNNNMHVLLHKSTITDITDQINTLKDEQYNIKTAGGDYTNLLMRYLRQTNQAANGMPLTSLITSHNAAPLLSYQYIKQIEFFDTENRIDITVDPLLFDSAAVVTDDQETVLSIYYEDNGDEVVISKVALASSYTTETEAIDTTTDINVSIALLDDNDNNKTYIDSLKNIDMTHYNSSTSSQFVDLDGFKTLMTCLISTTENNYFEFSGSLSIPISLWNWTLSSVSTNITAKVFVQDNTAYADIRCNNGGKSMSDDGYYCTEFFIKEKEVWVARTRTSISEKSTGYLWWKETYNVWTISTEVFKTTQEVILDNIAYWLLEFILNISSMTFGGYILGNVFHAINDSSNDSSVVKSDDFSSVVDEMTLNTSTGLFHLSLDLNDVLDLSPLTFSENITVDIYYNTTTNCFSSFSIGGKMSVASIVNITIETCSFSFTGKYLSPSDINNYTDGALTKYDAFVSEFESKYSSLPEYTITSVEGKQHWYAVTYDYYDITDNSSSAVKTVSYECSRNYSAPSSSLHV